jgi:hypothetical protein
MLFMNKLMRKQKSIQNLVIPVQNKPDHFVSDIQVIENILYHHYTLSLVFIVLYKTNLENVDVTFC